MGDVRSVSRPAVRWVSCPRPDGAAAVRLFCLPYAGAGGSIFRRWPERLTGVAEVCPILLPGREARYHETAYTRMEPLVGAIVQGIAQHLDRPFAFYGHSMGALIGFEVCRRLERDCGVRPVCVFISAARPPHARWSEESVHHLPDGEFLDRLHNRYHAIPDAVRDNPELASVVLPALRADFELLETYTPLASTALGCDMVAYAGRGDDTVRLCEMDEWRRYAGGRFRRCVFDGDHFFVRSREGEVVADLAGEIRRRGALAG